MKRLGVIAFTRKGCVLAQRVAKGLPQYADYADSQVEVCGPERFADELGIDAYENLDAWTAAHFPHDDALVFVGASGIAVRAIAPYVRDKFSDPAVVSVDERGSFVVPLLSGHVGGANDLARTVARIVGGQAAISTATDVNELFAVDEWAARNGLAIVERVIAREVSAALLEGKPVGFQSNCGFEAFNQATLPSGVTQGPAEVGFVVSLDEEFSPFSRTLHLVPQVVTVGVGCRRDTDPVVLEQAVDQALAAARISPHAVKGMASIDVKSDEPAIRQLASARGWGLRFYTAEELAAVPGDFASSEFVERTVGVGNVCERAACAEGGTLVGKRQAGNGVTVAIAINEK